MKDIELMEIALKYIEKQYSLDDLRYGDDLYDATPEEKKKCVNFYVECQDIGKIAFMKKIKEVPPNA